MGGGQSGCGGLPAVPRPPWSRGLRASALPAAAWQGFRHHNVGPAVPCPCSDLAHWRAGGPAGFPRAVSPGATAGRLRQHDSFFRRCRGRKSGCRCSSLGSLCGSGREPALSPRFRWFLATLGVRCLVTSSRLSSRRVPVPKPPLLPFPRCLSLDEGPPKSVGPHRTSITRTKPLFPNKGTF